MAPLATVNGEDLDPLSAIRLSIFAGGSFVEDAVSSGLLRQWVDDPRATPGDLEKIARTDETDWQDARREFLLY